MASATCPSCGLGLRGLPESRRVLVICPSAKGGCGTRFYHPPTERSVIGMRCAHDGRRFTVILVRSGGDAKFTIERVAISVTSNDGYSDGAGAYNADVYDFTGFYCPCCGYAPDTLQDSFVHCGTCRELVCQALTYKKLDGPASSVKWFVCYPNCGHQGPVNGHIQEYSATCTATTERAAAGRLQGPPAALRLGKG